MNAKQFSISQAAKIASLDLAEQRRLLTYCAKDLSAYFAQDKSASTKKPVSPEIPQTTMTPLNYSPSTLEKYCQFIDYETKNIICSLAFSEFQHDDLDTVLLSWLVINTEGELISRRSFYLKQLRLKRQYIPVLMLDLTALLLGQFTLNEIQKWLLMSDIIAIGVRLENYLGKRQGERSDLIINSQESTDNNQSSNKNNSSLPPKMAEVKKMMCGQETREYVAHCIGMKRESYRQGKKILRFAIWQVIQACNQGTLRLYQAAKIAKLSPQQQLNFLQHRSQSQ